jgi:hypothetical protein
MSRSVRRFTVAMGVAGMVFMVPVALAWACVGLVSLTAKNPTVQPGGTVTVVGKEFAQGAPVDIHLDTIDGPILASAPPPTTTMTSQFTQDVPIPANISAGPHVLIATQNEHNMNAGAPARTVIYVGTSAAAPAAPAARPAKLLVSSGPSVASRIVIGIGVAAVCLFLAGVFMAASSRRRAEPEAVKVS